MEEVEQLGVLGVLERDDFGVVVLLDGLGFGVDEVGELLEELLDEFVLEQHSLRLDLPLELGLQFRSEMDVFH